MLTLTPQIRARFVIDAERLTPNQLIRELLRAEVDLLWFGGIGTFVKCADESRAEAGDRANDSVRVDARELRCKVIGEGANLGITQLGRIEFARAGGRINTDFIDNSAGVDCSDHEVNIKILRRRGRPDDEAAQPAARRDDR
jgi:glutamate dehydrogenase